MSKLLGTESETYLQRCLRPLQLYGDQALIDEDPLGQVKFVRLFKFTVNVIVMKPDNKLII